MRRRERITLAKMLACVGLTLAFFAAMPFVLLYFAARGDVDELGQMFQWR